MVTVHLTIIFCKYFVDDFVLTYTFIPIISVLLTTVLHLINSTVFKLYRVANTHREGGGGGRERERERGAHTHARARARTHTHKQTQTNIPQAGVYINGIKHVLEFHCKGHRASIAKDV